MTHYEAVCKERCPEGCGKEKPPRFVRLPAPHGGWYHADEEGYDFPCTAPESEDQFMEELAADNKTAEAFAEIQRSIADQRLGSLNEKIAEINTLQQERDSLKAQVHNLEDYINTIRLNIPAEYTKQPQLDLCVQRLKDKIISQAQEIEALKRDKEMLDWLENEYGEEQGERSIHLYFKANKTLREAIRAAMEGR